MNTSNVSRVLVWDLPTRLFHWLLAASFAGAWLTSESERFADVHAMLGYTMVLLVAFRILWGVAGTRYARFAARLPRGAFEPVADARHEVLMERDPMRGQFLEAFDAFAAPLVRDISRAARPGAA